MVGKGGIEPPQPFDNGFTDRPSSPTLALARVIIFVRGYNFLDLLPIPNSNNHYLFCLGLYDLLAVYFLDLV